jgi:hypothetical protein
MPVDPALAHHRAVRAANVRWSRPGERQRQRGKISEARQRHHEALVDPNGTLKPAERRKLAQNSLQAEMAALALASAKARRARKSGGAGDDQAA